jgi:hypothetical protein
MLTVMMTALSILAGFAAFLRRLVRTSPPERHEALRKEEKADQALRRVSNSVEGRIIEIWRDLNKGI